MVQLNKPIKLTALKGGDTTLDDDVESIEEVSDHLPDEETLENDENTTKIDSRIEDKFDLLLSGLCIFLFLITIGVVGYTFLYFENEEISPELRVKATKNVTSFKPLQVKEPYEGDQIKGQLTGEEEIDAAAFYAYNPVTHQVYFSGTVDQELPIASITKLLSVLVAIDEIPLDQVLIAQRDYYEKLDWTLELKRGDRITMEDAVNAMLISSYNDAAYLLADNYPGGYKEFIVDMNQKAERLGMEDSNFDNPAGLDSEALYSTARDLKRLVQATLQEEDLVRISGRSSGNITILRNQSSLPNLLSEEDDQGDSILFPTITFNNYEEVVLEEDVVTLYTSNSLLGSDPYIKGLKTGYTEGAGQSFISYYLVNDSDQLVTIILNAKEDRFDETEKLVDLVRTFY